ncbi:hypothetical protein JAAARDRAFT_51959, partial [Jaapia argillacea MUCL 33604]
NGRSVTVMADLVPWIGVAVTPASVGDLALILGIEVISLAHRDIHGVALQVVAVAVAVAGTGTAVDVIHVQGLIVALITTATVVADLTSDAVLAVLIIDTATTSRM